MSLIPDPRFLYYIAKNYNFVNRLWEFNKKELKLFQTKSFKKALKNADNTEIYKKKFKEAKIDINKISSIDDIKKFPFTSKQDFRDAGTKATVPNGFNLDKSFKVDTSGSTGRPVSIYRDLNAVALESLFIRRIQKSYDLHPTKIRITNIGDFGIPNSYDEECLVKGVEQKLGFLRSFSTKNVQNIYAGIPVKDILEQLESFKPELIVSYPGILIGLMKLKEQGKVKNFNPKYVASSGGILDPYTKKQFENVFDAKIFSLYAATESGPLAFECPEGKYHVQSDLSYVEAIDENQKLVANGKHGHLVLTRFYTGGTPIIRYTGMDDIITISDEESCDCGMHSQILENVEGRTADAIIIPDGRIFPAATFTLIPGEVAQDYKIDVIRRFQIIQNKIDEIEILVVFNQDLKKSEKMGKEILHEIKKRYQKVVGKSVNVLVKEVDKVKKDKRAPTTSLSSIVVSNIDHKDYL